MNYDPISRIELGVGNKPTPGYLHVDKYKHSPHVDIEADLEKIPWPFENDSVVEILAIDVFEHLRLDVIQWLDECWRILKPNGMLVMRLPAWDNHYSWRDPTHRRVFHPESFHYWCPNAPGTVWQDFGRYYWGEGYEKWWNLIGVMRDSQDWKYTLQKRT